MHDILKRHAVFVLRDAGFSLAEIAKQAKVSTATVKRILNEEPITELPKETTSDVGRPSIVRPFEAQIKTILGEDPDLPSVEILHRLRQAKYAGGKTALYELIRELRPTITRPMVRFEGLAGEFSQHDFGMVRVKYENGKIEPITFFASRLKWSRWTQVVIVPGQSVEPLVRALLLGFQSFGGVPLVAVFDNPTTIVISRDGDKIEWNQTFGQVALDFRFAPELCYPAMANQKGSVENLVGWVKGSFFKVRRFHDRDDMERQLAEWHDEVNHKRPSRATNVPPATRIEEERKRLRALAFDPQEYALRFPIFVGPTGWVEFRKIRYSMPPEAINMPGTLFLYQDRVKIQVKQHQAEHPRIPANGSVSSRLEHTAAGLAHVSGKRAKLYYQRQRLLELGETAEAFLTELVHARPRTWAHDVERLFDSLQGVGPERMISAMRGALEKKLYGAEYVIDLLQETLWK